MTFRSPEFERRGAAGSVSASGRRLVGYAARFGVEARIGGFREVIRRGAFAQSLAGKRDILALVDHDPKALLGRTKTGTLSLREDDDGLAFELALPDTRAAADVLALAERGDIGGMSFGFVATDDHWTGDLRELRSVELHEVSIVQSWPAYEQTQVLVRNRQHVDADLRRLWMVTV